MKNGLAITVCTFALLTAGLVPAKAEQPDAMQASSIQDTPVQTAQNEKDTPEERLALSRELHDIRRVKDMVIRDIETISKQLPPTEQLDFQKYMELKVDFDELEEKSIEIAANVYTAAELRAMIAYFGSDVGRSAEQKGAQYSESFGKEVQKKIDEALMATKFDNLDHLPRSEQKIEPNKDMLGR